jgi:hypothetical protein
VLECGATIGEGGGGGSDVRSASWFTGSDRAAECSWTVAGGHGDVVAECSWTMAGGQGIGVMLWLSLEGEMTFLREVEWGNHCGAQEHIKVDRVLHNTNRKAFGLPFHGESKCCFPVKRLELS